MSAKLRWRNISSPSGSFKICFVIALSLGGLTIFSSPLQAQSLLKQDDRIAICGDSITEQKLYSVYLELYLRLCQPTKVSTIQFGWSGESTWGLAPRMAHDVLAFKPTIATTCYGMNDSGGHEPLGEERIALFTTNLRSILQQFKDANTRVIVGSPGVVDTHAYLRSPEKAIGKNRNLAQFRDITKELAAEYGMVFVDVFAAMDDAMGKLKQKHGEQYHLAGADGVHPAANGQLVMAYAFLKGMGFAGNIGDIKVDLTSGEATASEGHHVDSASAGSVTLTSSRFPFCFFGNPAEPTATRGVIEVVPFNQDLNRLMLMVSGVKSDKVRVTWGDVSREFPASEVAQGINLSAEFLDNPFSVPFGSIEKAVREKQTFETQAFKNLIPALRTIIDDDQERAAEKTVTDAILQKWQEKDAAVSAAIKPVTHTIRIEEVK